MFDILEIDTSEVDAVIEKGAREFHKDMLETVQRACVEGAQEARDKHVYENRTGDLTDSIGVGNRFRVTEKVIEGEIVATMKYASFVDEWESTQTADTYMEKAAQKAQRVLEAGIEVATVKMNHAMNR